MREKEARKIISNLKDWNDGKTESMDPMGKIIYAEAYLEAIEKARKLATALNYISINPDVNWQGKKDIAKQALKEWREER